MGHKVPWKTGVLICHLVTLRPLISRRKRLVYLPVTSRPPIRQFHSAFLSPLNFATHEVEDPFATPQRENIFLYMTISRVQNPSKTMRNNNSQGVVFVTAGRGQPPKGPGLQLLKTLRHSIP